MDVVKFGLFIAEQRKLQGMTQNELGDAIGVSGKAVSKWERGVSFPDALLLPRIASALRCTVSHLMDCRIPDISKSSRGNWLPDESAEDVEQLPYAKDVVVIPEENASLVVSPYLFGTNLEHSRATLAGGLSAQMLRNRKFAGIPTMDGAATEWSRIGARTYLSFGGAYTKHADGYSMYHRINERSSQVITGFGDGESGLAQDRLFYAANTAYDFRIVARVSRPLTLEVRLTDGTNSLAKASLSLDGDAFAVYTATLVTAGGCKSGRLEIVFSDAGSLTVGALSLMPSDNYYGMRPDVIASLCELGPTFLRWPGGNYAGEYYWKDGLLPVDQRSPVQSYLGVQTQPYTMGYDDQEIGIDEFIALCRAVGAEPSITINQTWNTPEENAQWVEYCNGDETTRYGRLRIERGFAEPYRVQLWSLGNEAGYEHMEGDNTPDGYRRIVRKHANRMLEVDPSLTLCTSGNYPKEDWAERAARPLAALSQLVSLHHYAFYPTYSDPATYKKEYYEFLRKVDTEYLAKIRQLREQLADDRLHIAFDEWNAWHAWHRASGNVTDGMFGASLMHAFIRASHPYDMPIAAHFEAINEGAIEVLPDAVRLTPMGQALAMMRRHAGGRLLFAKEDAVLTEHDGGRVLTLINRSYDTPKRFVLPKEGELRSATVYTSKDVLPFSAFTEEEGCVMESAGERVLTLPPHSMALVLFS